MSEPLQLLAHPFSSYCQKVLISLYENGTPFGLRMLRWDDAAMMAEFSRRWPMRKMPVLVDGQRTVVESSIIIEYLQIQHPGPVRLIPADATEALEVRFMDRFFDLYIMSPQQKLVADRLRPQERRDPHGVDEARAQLDTAYAWLEAAMQGRQWAAGERFSLADCAAAPALFYADWSHRIGPQFERVHAYRRRLLARPSFARAVHEARPFRDLFPLGAPDRD